MLFADFVESQKDTYPELYEAYQQLVNGKVILDLSYNEPKKEKINYQDIDTSNFWKCKE